MDRLKSAFTRRDGGSRRPRAGSPHVLGLRGGAPPSKGFPPRPEHYHRGKLGKALGGSTAAQAHNDKDWNSTKFARAQSGESQRNGLGSGQHTTATDTNTSLGVHADSGSSRTSSDETDQTASPKENGVLEPSRGVWVSPTVVEAKRAERNEKRTGKHHSAGDLKVPDSARRLVRIWSPAETNSRDETVTPPKPANTLKTAWSRLLKRTSPVATREELIAATNAVPVTGPATAGAEAYALGAAAAAAFSATNSRNALNDSSDSSSTPPSSLRSSVELENRGPNSQADRHLTPPSSVENSQELSGPHQQLTSPSSPTSSVGGALELSGHSAPAQKAQKEQPHVNNHVDNSARVNSSNSGGLNGAAPSFVSNAASSSLPALPATTSDTRELLPPPYFENLGEDTAFSEIRRLMTMKDGTSEAIFVGFDLERHTVNYEITEIGLCVLDPEQLPHDAGKGGRDWWAKTQNFHLINEKYQTYQGERDSSFKHHPGDFAFDDSQVISHDKLWERMMEIITEAAKPSLSSDSRQCRNIVLVAWGQHLEKTELERAFDKKYLEAKGIQLWDLQLQREVLAHNNNLHGKFGDFLAGLGIRSFSIDFGIDLLHNGGNDAVLEIHALITLACMTDREMNQFIGPGRFQTSAPMRQGWSNTTLAVNVRQQRLKEAALTWWESHPWTTEMDDMIDSQLQYAMALSASSALQQDEVLRDTSKVILEHLKERMPEPTLPAEAEFIVLWWNYGQLVHRMNTMAAEQQGTQDLNTLAITFDPHL